MDLKPAAIAHLDDLTRRLPSLAGIIGALGAAAATICATHRRDGQLLICGNGGSAADSEHIAGELVKSFVLQRTIPDAEAARLAGLGAGGLTLSRSLQQGVRAISLTSNSALLTAIGNDTDPTLVFAQQVYVHGRPGDVLLALSTSGNSPNIVHALEVAHAFDLHTIGLTNQTPSTMDAFCDILIQAPGNSTHVVQEFHMQIYHTLCLVIEQELFG